MLEPIFERVVTEIEVTSLAHGTSTCAVPPTRSHPHLSARYSHRGGPRAYGPLPALGNRSSCVGLNPRGGSLLIVNDVFAPARSNTDVGLGRAVVVGCSADVVCVVVGHTSLSLVGPGVERCHPSTHGVVMGCHGLWESVRTLCRTRWIGLQATTIYVLFRLTYDVISTLRLEFSREPTSDTRPVAVRLRPRYRVQAENHVAQSEME